MHSISHLNDAGLIKNRIVWGVGVMLSVGVGDFSSRREQVINYIRSWQIVIFLIQASYYIY